jgi:Fe-S cluster assembly protein SufD
MSLWQSLDSAFQARRNPGPGLVTARADAAKAALAHGLPGTRDERWKYTPLRALGARRFADTAPATVPAERLAAVPAPRAVWVNGRFDAGLSDLAGLPAGVAFEPLGAALMGDDARAVAALGRVFARKDEAFAQWNAALADDGALLRVDAEVAVPMPVHLVFVGAPAPDAALHLRHVVELGRGASLRVCEHHFADGPHAHLLNHLWHLHVAPDAALHWVRLQGDCPASTLLARTDAVLGRAARLHRLDLELGAALSRHELNARLEGDGAHLQADGVLLGDGRRHVDTRLGIEHIARDTRCDLTWRGFGADRSRVVFHGGITIREGADGSAAMLANKNLLVSDNAEVDTQPVLVIHADEVQAAHGATVGRLDEQALFYLRARGVPRADATAMLTAAFLREPVEQLADDALRALATAALDAHLAKSVTA